MEPVSTFKLGSADARLFHGDALDCLFKLSPECVDLIVTSPPYFIGKDYDASRSVKDFLAELRRVLPAMTRCLKPGGSLCWQVGNHVQDARLTPLDAMVVAELQSSDSLVLRNRIIWTFGHGAHATMRFSGRHETVLWYTKGSSYRFDLDASRVPQRYPGKKHYKGPKKGQWSANPLGKNPGDVWDIGDIWDIPNVKANHIEKTEHPCQFPTALVRRLIVTLSSKGGLVVDPYLGSGTSAVAAIMEGRNFVGCELEGRYLRISEDRIECLVRGDLRVREDIPVRAPNPKSTVAKRPSHFASSSEVARGS